MKRDSFLDVQIAEQQQQGASSLVRFEYGLLGGRQFQIEFQFQIECIGIKVFPPVAGLTHMVHTESLVLLRGVSSAYKPPESCSPTLAAGEVNVYK